MLRQWTADTAISGFVQFSFFLALCILFGDLTYRLLERPFLTLKQHLDRSQQITSKPETLPAATETTVAAGKR